MIQKLFELSHWQIDLIVVWLFVQGAFFTLFPEEVILPTLGILWGQGRVGFVEASLASFLGLVSGDLILFALGRKFGLKILTRKPLSWITDEDLLQATIDWVKKYGAWIIFFVRFMPTLRAPMYFAAGIARMTYFRFLRSDLLGQVLWIPALILVGRRIGSTGSIEQGFQQLGKVMVGIICLSVGVNVFRKVQKRLRVPADSE